MVAPEYLTVPPRAAHSATVIFVHGLGDTGHGWTPLATTFSNESAFAHIKWILPHAPRIPVSINGGALMPSWYNVIQTDAGMKLDEEGLLRSSHSLTDLILKEIDSGIPSKRIVLGGFSQGGTLSLLTGLTTELNLGGVVILSGRLALKDKIKDMTTERARSLPFFWGHGMQDPLIKITETQDSIAFMQRELGIRLSTREDVTGLESHSYEGLAHSADDAELKDLRAWLQRVVPSA